MTSTMNNAFLVVAQSNRMILLVPGCCYYSSYQYHESVISKQKRKRNVYKNAKHLDCCRVFFCHQKMSTTQNLSAEIKDEKILSLAPKIRYDCIPVLRLFLAKYRTFPCKFETRGLIDGTRFHIPTIVKYIRDELKHDVTKDCIERQYHRETKQKFISTQACDLGNGLVISWNDSSIESDVQNPNNIKSDHDDKYFHVAYDITFYYFRQYDEYVQQLADIFCEMTVLESKSCSLQMICKNEDGLYTRGIKIKKPLITDMALHYGQKFVPIHNKIMSSLNEKESHGIVLLHGVPGSGKYKNSTIILYLFSNIFHFRKNTLYSIFDSRNQR